MNGTSLRVDSRRRRRKEAALPLVHSVPSTNGLVRRRAWHGEKVLFLWRHKNTKHTIRVLPLSLTEVVKWKWGQDQKKKKTSLPSIYSYRHDPPPRKGLGKVLPTTSWLVPSCLHSSLFPPLVPSSLSNWERGGKCVSFCPCLEQQRASVF